MSNKNKKFFLISIIFSLVYGAFLYFTTKDKNERIDYILKKELDNLNIHYTLTTTSFYAYAKRDMKSTIQKDEKIIDILSKAQSSSKEQRALLREKLYKLVKPLYKKMLRRGILQFQFVFPDNRSFLRVHKLDKFDDDLSDVRYTYKFTNENKRDSGGFEQGRTAHAFRFVFPIFDKGNNHLGAVEISLASEYIQESLSAFSNIHSHFIVAKNVFDTKSWDSKHMVTNYVPSIEHKDYLFTSQKSSYTIEKLNSTKKIIDSLRDKIDANFAHKKEFVIYKLMSDDAKVIAFLPVKNFKDKKVVAYLVSYTDNKNIYDIYFEYILRNIITLFMFIFVAYFIYKELSHKEELQMEVNDKTRELKEINENLEMKVSKGVETNMKQQMQLFEQSKMAMMGTMIGNIAHQWRQPLGVISSTASGLKAQQELSILKEDNIPKMMDNISDQVNYLSETINTFRNFLKEKKEIQKVVLQDRINISLSIVGVALKDNHIELIKNIDENNPIEITMVIGELSQVIINIVNNAKDVLLEKNIQDPCVRLELFKENNRAIITIEDNAGGIPEDILPHIFDEYFTTKDDSKGTGLGLFMGHKIITESLNGKLYAKNGQNGAKFFIELPLNS